MPPVENNEPIRLRVSPEQMSALTQASALLGVDLADFVLESALLKAAAMLSGAETIVLSERDSLVVLDALENPPAPNAALRKAIAARRSMVCPVCGAAELVRDTRDLPYTYKGETTMIPAVTADFCPACGESITDIAETGRVMREMRAFDQRVDAGQP